MASPPAYQTLDLTIREQVATITMLPRSRAVGADNHVEMADVFTRLRADDTVRVVVLTGTGQTFKVPPAREHYEGADRSNRTADPTHAWQTFGGIIRCHQAMAELEKPIVCRMNGDAIGFGQSLAFACDLIVAVDDARFMDHHMGGTFTAQYADGVHEGGHTFSSVPGDGGLALAPLHLSLLKAKEYLMLAEPIEARQLAAWGIINFAVPRDQLDARVDEIVRRLLQRGAYALAWTKRVLNRRVVDHLNLTLDAGVAYEMLSFIQREHTGGVDKLSLD
jgi:enoyl-CoA hydratase/carnithine racemase